MCKSQYYTNLLFVRSAYMNKKVIIASDSTCDLGPELISRYNIQILPLSVNLGERIYTDGVDIDPDMIYRHYEEKHELPKTAAPNVLDFETFYQKYTAQGYAVVMFTISATMSSTTTMRVLPHWILRMFMQWIPAIFPRAGDFWFSTPPRWRLPVRALPRSPRSAVPSRIRWTLPS